jgi:hypothetical protein
MNLQIFRLRSGEELICQVIEETKTKFKISNPFVFKSSTMTDKNGQYDMTILRDWLAQTNDKTVLIPKNHIALQYEPKEDTKKLYVLQLDSEKNLDERIVSSENESAANDLLEHEQLFHDFLNSLVQDVTQNQSDFADWNNPEHKPLKGKRKKQKQPSVEFAPGELDRHGIYVTMMIPSEAIMNLITANILDPQDLLRMIKEVKRKNRFTGDEKNRSDFGNKMSDWNPDPGSDEYK